MLNISFYLLAPKAKGQTQLYVSLSNKEGRLRFATGEMFIAAYCNPRGKKGGKDLVKKNTPFYFDYSSAITGIRDTLLLIERQLLREHGSSAVEQIRDVYWQRIGRLKDETRLPFFEVLEQYKEASKLHWADSFLKVQNSLTKHLSEFEHSEGIRLDLKTFDEGTWQALTNYFITSKKITNTSTNKYLKTLKQFLRHAGKKGLFTNIHKLDEWKYLAELEPFKIALNEGEVATLIGLKLVDSPRLDKVRDLFLLEIFTGQRYSDIQKVLDRNNADGKYIKIYQQKTGELVAIPKHTRLENHLGELLKKYPNGFPEISNQKFNDYLKEVCELAGFTQTHQWMKLVGKKKIPLKDFRYNLISSHTGRRTFCTIALKKGIDAELIMKVTGHRKYDQFREYVKVDDTDVEAAFSEKF